MILKGLPPFPHQPIHRQVPIAQVLFPQSLFSPSIVLVLSILHFSVFLLFLFHLHHFFLPTLRTSIITEPIIPRLRTTINVTSAVFHHSVTFTIIVSSVNLFKSIPNKLTHTTLPTIPAMLCTTSIRQASDCL